MQLNLTKPICFFDLETTGINITHDRIVEISILKVFPNGTEESKTWLVNPEMTIPNEVIEIHGITNEKDLDSDGDGCPDAKEVNIANALNSGNIQNKVSGVLTNQNYEISEGQYLLASAKITQTIPETKTLI